MSITNKKISSASSSRNTVASRLDKNSIIQHLKANFFLVVKVMNSWLSCRVLMPLKIRLIEKHAVEDPSPLVVWVRKCSSLDHMRSVALFQSGTLLQYPFSFAEGKRSEEIFHMHPLELIFWMEVLKKYVTILEKLVCLAAPYTVAITKRVSTGLDPSSP
ncbi:hypothetical protein TNCV_505221 [Trichonephila clavipes]|nr:hypothetical protein TNCV_505221 [Trichonephila clavipes]